VPYRSQVSADYTARGHWCAVTNVVITHNLGKSLCVACKTLKTSIQNKLVTENNATRFLKALHLISFQCIKPPNSAERGSKTNISSTVHIFLWGQHLFSWQCINTVFIQECGRKILLVIDPVNGWRNVASFTLWPLYTCLAIWVNNCQWSWVALHLDAILMWDS
jgi:hypothetical protein